MRTTKIWGLNKFRADILGRSITVYSTYDVEIVAEASREIARLKIENARLNKLLREMRTDAEKLQCSSM